jgi:steroid 5-alpha reductase family enzyme
MLQEEPEQQETQPLASVAPQQTTEPVPQEPEPEPAPQEPEPEGTFVGEHMPVSNEKQLASVLTSTAIVNGLLQGAAWLCGGGKMHVMAAIATGVHYLVLIHASGNVFGNQRTEKFFDITGSLTYATVCVVALSTAPGGVQALSQRQLLLAGMVLLWCGRLGTFLFLRIQKHGGLDPRFERPKKYFSTFFTFWNVSAVWVFATSLPALTVLTTDRGPAALGPVDYVGIAGWVVGFLFEVTADYQKETWRARPENREKKTWITEGLWSVCRHPNYFGEILIWSSVLLISMQSLTAASSPK